MRKKAMKGMKNNRRSKMILCSILAGSILLGSNWFTLGYDVYQNGEQHGTVSAMEQIDATESYLKIMPKGAEAVISPDTEEAPEMGCILYLNNEPILAVESQEMMEELLMEYEAKNAEDGTSTLNKVVTWSTEELNGVSLYSKEEAENILSAIEEGGFPLLSVISVTKETWEEEIPFETTYENTDTLTQGHSIVKVEGKPGITLHHGYSIWVNKEEVAQKELSQEVTQNPEPAVVLVGTREPASGEGTGTYIKPCSGSLSSGFGARWGRNHNGVDLAAPHGTSITAADTGVVTYAGWNSGGYGNLVIIDHGNGIETYYGHCSEVLVQKGAVIEQGELIAKVGSTGRSTGNHLHFEIRVNGSPVNPTEYLSF